MINFSSQNIEERIAVKFSGRQQTTNIYLKAVDTIGNYSK